MPVPFSRSAQKAEQEKLTPERILALAARPQGFSVSWRYRDDWLASRCRKLRSAGKLRVKKGRGETTYFALAPQTIAQPAKASPSQEADRG